VVSNKKIFKISTNQNTLWALAAMLDFLNIGPYGNFTFSSFFLKPQNRFESNLAEMFIGWSYTRFLFLVLIENPTCPCHVCFKLADWFQKRRLLNIFSIGSYVKIKSSHGGHLEFPISKRFTSLIQDHMAAMSRHSFNIETYGSMGFE
jgi:hypothetical protein